MKFIFITILLAHCFALPAQQLDTANSWIEFTIIKMKDHEVNGTIRGMHGVIAFKDGDLDRIEICIKPGTVRTDQKLRDNNLKKEKYFDVANHPSICFVSDSIVNSETGVLAYGQLQMLGIQQREMFTIRQTATGLEGSTVINRMDYGLGGEPFFKIGEDVTIRVHCAFIP